jgi:hypothetical protein
MLRNTLNTECFLVRVDSAINFADVTAMFELCMFGDPNVT